MACEYFVNGSWVSETELKEILNNGLLDNLISNNTVNLKGFNVDQNKVLSTQEKRTERTTVPANKLADILAKEIKSRKGYPLNMLSSLELTEDGNEFKIPLWASPYASKFENLLTALVTNKVIKQKMPGGSYVLGSEEGFRIKEGDETAGELKNSSIVFSDSFNPTKGLQPMRYDPETKKILPAQIMLPFKFRDEAGNILELEQFMKRGEDGRFMIDFDKIPKKVLNLFGFRIPTQERNSMAAVEVVGFLPESMGDLVLAPRDFTKQMGSDFDVDKLYTYMYNTFYDNGKIYTNFMSDESKIEGLIKIQKQTIEDLKEEFKLNKEDRKLIDDYIKEKLEINENNEEVPSELAQKASEIISKSLSEDLAKKLNSAFNRLSVLNRSYKASKQNKILDIHLDIMTSSNPEVISSIIALDSFGEFESLSKEVNKIRESQGLIPAMGTILSETYQRTKYINATAGKNGVGSFSLDSTFNATVQGKDLVITNLTEEDRVALFGTSKNPKTPTSQDILESNMPVAIFGDVISQGDISNKYTLRSQSIINKAKAEKRELTDKEKESLKFKSTIIRALQSTAVDNEKAQILDKLNINDETFDTIRALTSLGFEEKEIVGLITQEIIWEYVDKVKRSRSSLATFDSNAEEKIVEELRAKYDSEGRYGKLTPLQKEKFASNSADRLMENLGSKKLVPTVNVTTNENNEVEVKREVTSDFNLEQIALLEKFRKLAETGKDVKRLQSTINADSKGVPKSFLEVESKLRQIKNLGTSNIFNAESLLGKLDNYGNLTEPTTLNGFATHYGTQFAGKIFENYFPYKDAGFKTLVQEIQSYTPQGINMSIAKQTEMQEDVFSNVRSFLYANSNTNLFGDNPDLERRRLFIDATDNMSLASILNSLQKEEWFQKNGFLNKLSFNINKNGSISRINFEAAAGENFDERNIYDGFSYLLSKDFFIGTFNGIDYTSRTLAQDMVASAFLEGGNQGSKQYLKYVPVAYLKTLGFGEYLNGVPFDFVNTFFGNSSEGGPVYSMPSAFARQYFQNNPDKVKTLSQEDIVEQITPKLSEFKLTPAALKNNFVEIIDPSTGDTTMHQTQFVSIYNSKEPSKYLLFEFDSVSRSYKRIPVLAQEYGFVAYNSERRNSIPIEASEIVTTPAPEQSIPGYTIPNIPVEPTKEFKMGVANNPAPTMLAQDLPIDFSLTGPEAIEDLFDILEDAPGVSKLNSQLMILIQNLELPEKFKLNYAKLGKEISGGYDYDTDTLTINTSILNELSVDEFATMVNHELIHALSGKSIKLYEAKQYDKLSEKQIKAIQELERVQKLYINNIIAQEGKEKVNAFIAKYNKWKKEKGAPTWTNEEISKYYGALKLSEFITMALTDSTFQSYLNSVPGENNRTLWEQIKDLLSNLLNAMGLDINPNSILATAIKDSMDVIEASQPVKAGPVSTTIDTYKYFGAVYNITLENGVPVDVNIKRGDSETNIKFQERKNKILAAYKANPNVDPQNNKPFRSTLQESNKRKYTPENITTLQPNQVFVFGSNTEGRHGAGAAKIAITKFGAKYGQASGFQGQSYGIITKNLSKGKRGISLTDLADNIDSFIVDAIENPNLEFLVTKIGTGLGGFTVNEVKEIFKDYLELDMLPDNIILPKEFEVRTTQPSTSVEEDVVNNKYELFPGVFANQGQTEAIDLISEFLTSDKKAFLLQGKGGTGKTTIIKKVLDSIREEKKILAIAPSHKAKKVLDKSINADKNAKNIPTTTLASALAIKLDESTGKFAPDEFARNMGRVPIRKASIILIDESSMVSDKLLQEIKQMMSPDAKIIFMGDKAQLPPVGQETDSKVFDISNGYTLTEKMRQAATSPIINIGTKVSANVESENPVLNPIQQSDRVNITDPASKSSIKWEANEDAALNEFVEDFSEGKGDVNYAKIVTFNNQNHNNPQSVKNLNQKVRAKLFGKEALENQFLPGEMLTSYDSFSQDPTNREIPAAFNNSEDLIVVESEFIEEVPIIVTVESRAKGKRTRRFSFDIQSVNLKNEDGKILENIPVIAESSKQEYQQTLAALFREDPQLAYGLASRYANLEYGYAITSHKAQGSTYTNVYVMEDNIMGPSNGGSVKAKNQSLYVAVSRPTTKLVMVSAKNAQEVFDQEGFYVGDNSNKMTQEDWENYSSIQDLFDESITQSPINRDALEKYLLICGK